MLEYPGGIQFSGPILGATKSALAPTGGTWGRQAAFGEALPGRRGMGDEKLGSGSGLVVVIAGDLGSGSGPVVVIAGDLGSGSWITRGAPRLALWLSH